ncbi:MAG: hypothetical protein ACE5GE_16765, partial [Phycisphaerae bacterium]
EPFVRQLLAGYPQFTEDVVPGQGRAIKAVGTKLLVPEEQLRIALDYEPQEYFFLQDTVALYLRPAGAPQWSERPIEDLPQYHDRVSSREEVWMPAGESVPIRPLDLTVTPAGQDDPLSDYEVHVTGYLRYAFQEERWVPGGDRLNPVCNVNLSFDNGTGEDIELVAFHSSASQAKGGMLVFRWIETDAELTALASQPGPELEVRIPGEDIVLKVPAVPPEHGGEHAEFQSIEGTDYSFRIRNVVNNLNVPAGGGNRNVSVVIVEVRNGDRSYRRWVAIPAEFTRDLADDGGGAVEADPGIEMSYRPGGAAMLTIAAGPGEVGTHLLVRNSEGAVKQHDLKAGKTVTLAGNLKLRLNHIYPHTRSERRPAIVPLAQRDRDARKAFSMIKVVVAKDDWSTSLWLPYNQYAVPSEQYQYPGRITYAPRRIRLPSGQSLELMYSRQRHKLPSPVVLDSFELQTFQGGLIGSNSNVRDYVSKLRFADDSGQWGEPVQMSSNNPATDRGFWFFQATWDPPGRGSNGMNFTGTGVGNRNGVYIQLFGCCVAVAGMIYAFYIKPIVIRRRQQAAELNRAARKSSAEQVGVKELEGAQVG